MAFLLSSLRRSSRYIFDGRQRIICSRFRVPRYNDSALRESSMAYDPASVMEITSSRSSSVRISQLMRHGAMLTSGPMDRPPTQASRIGLEDMALGIVGETAGGMQRGTSEHLLCDKEGQDEGEDRGHLGWSQQDTIKMPMLLPFFPRNLKFLLRCDVGISCNMLDKTELPP